MVAALLDANIIIDYLSRRHNFFDSAQKIIVACNNGEIDGYITSFSINNIAYVLRKQMTLHDVKSIIEKLCQFIEIIHLGKHHIYNALRDTDFNDFEDCLQYQCASSANVDYIITRDPQGFKYSDIPVLSPQEFCQRFTFQSQDFC